jgi:hypothetical protein
MRAIFMVFGLCVLLRCGEPAHTHPLSDGSGTGARFSLASYALFGQRLAAPVQINPCAICPGPCSTVEMTVWVGQRMARQVYTMQCHQAHNTVARGREPSHI